MRNIHVFVSRYLYNLNNQVRFPILQLITKIENDKDLRVKSISCCPAQAFSFRDLFYSRMNLSTFYFPHNIALFSLIFPLSPGILLSPWYSSFFLDFFPWYFLFLQVFFPLLEIPLLSPGLSLCCWGPPLHQSRTFSEYFLRSGEKCGKWENWNLK